MNEIELKQRRMTLANRLKSVREQKGMSQDQIAATMNISQSIISKYEGGLATVSLDVVILFADAYGCSIDYLLGRDVYDLNTVRGKLLSVVDRMDANKQLFLVAILEGFCV